CRDAQAGHDHLAHAEQTEDLCRVPSPRGGGNEGKGATTVWVVREARPPTGGFIAWVPIPNGRGRHRAAPFGVGPLGRGSGRFPHRSMPTSKVSSTPSLWSGWSSSSSTGSPTEGSSA